ncbi:hypothetical protein ET532_019765 [Verminephrobacter sp. Larva24]|nr:hypothetical protein ET532_019765 [Verminephrobacter sp. Larva24]
MPENTMAHDQTPHPDRRAQLRRSALEYHEFPKPGKLAIAATKQMLNQHDLALAYTPGVAAPCEEIAKDPNAAFRYTSRGNLVGVVTNGTAVLGLDERLGERACAVVVPKAGQTVDLPAIVEFLRAQKVAAQYIPERLVVRASIPSTPSGKMQKFKLREMLREELHGGP